MPLVESHSFDYWLGAEQSRYFGAGYRDVTYTDLAWNDGQATAGVLYPEGWSLDENDRPRQAHLSSVDAVVLALMAAQARCLDPSSLAAACIVGVELRAGPEPWTKLDAVPIELLAAQRDAATGVIELSVRAGNIGARIQLSGALLREHDVRPTIQGRPRHDVYPDSFASIRGRTRILEWDLPGRTVTAEHCFDLVAPVRDLFTGIQANAWPSATVIDYLVTMGQMTQALVCAVKGIQRTDMGNLWMRTMSIKANGFPSELPTMLTTRTRLVRERALNRDGVIIHDLLSASSSSDGVEASARLAFFETRNPIGSTVQVGRAA
ncbi:AvrD family protein [Leucobacter sp. wl10]|uniref:AvrD family protein n=1 Tax=Leucobacter sp. wl10 TaxID=2304677 RepID=UPI0013C3273A|nr:AvrD family protein [Leucobacter sp. wl10]